MSDLGALMEERDCYGSAYTRMKRSDYFSFSGKPLIDRIRISKSVKGVSISIDHDDCGPHSRIEMFEIPLIGL